MQLRSVALSLVISLAAVREIAGAQYYNCGDCLVPGDVTRTNYHPQLRTCVCNYDSFCCDVYWDQACVDYVRSSSHCNAQCYPHDVEFYNIKLKWDHALQYCYAYGSDLLSVHNKAELANALELLGHGSYGYIDDVWLGLNDKAHEGTFEWTDGSPVDFTPWKFGEPNGNAHDNQDCVAVKRVSSKCYSDKHFMDDDCEKKKHFLCKKKRTPQPTKPPTAAPTPYPTVQPTTVSTNLPTAYPTAYPTKAPTKEPTKAPTKVPTAPPTKVPTKAPTKEPTAPPTKVPTKAPTRVPTAYPTPEPVCYHTWEHVKYTWHDAEANCVSKGGHLVSIHSHAEDQALRTFAYTYYPDSYYVGYYTDAANTSTWTDGTPFDYHYWGVNHPETEQCGSWNQQADSSGLYYWWDVNCNLKYRSICKICQ